MPTYKQGDEKKYFRTILSGIILIVLLLAALIYKFIFAAEKDNLEEKLEIEEVNGISPTGDLVFPDAPPALEEPLSPP